MKKQKGFAMLFAVLVSSVLLSIGVSIFNLTVKELALSASGRESQFSFYAADTGAECALYWDFKGPSVLGGDVFATSTSTLPPLSGQPDCVDSSGAPQYITNENHPTAPTSNSAVTQFTLTIPSSPSNYCAIVKVTKDSSGGSPLTTIDSRGYNTPCDSTDPSRVERALKVTY